MEIEELKELITNFSLDNCLWGNQGYDRVLLQLFGFVGHGKSSFINTCKYVLDEKEFKVYAGLGDLQHIGTSVRASYPLTNTFTLVDNRGCAKMNSYETGEIFAQLGNLLPLDKEVLWETGYEGLVNRMVEEDMEANYSDFIVPIFIYSVKKGLKKEDVPDLKKILDTAKNLTGIVPIVVLTHKSQGDQTGLKLKFENMGIDHIFKLENFTPSDQLKTRSRHEEVLKFLYEIVKDVKFHLREERDAKLERAERKKFVLQLVHKRELESEKENIREQAKKEQERANNANNKSIFYRLAKYMRLRK